MSLRSCWWHADGPDAGGGPPPEHPLPVLDPLEAGADPAQRALADALRVSFRVLKAIMFLLVAAYLALGTFNVQPEEQVVILRLGRIAGPPRDPGLHWSFPEPIDERVRIPVRQTQRLGVSFWFRDPNPGEPLERKIASLPGLRPGVDDALLTGDGNLVHVQLTANYRISDPIRYVQNVGNPARPGEPPTERAHVESAVRAAAIRVFARRDVDTILRGQLADILEEVRRDAQHTLDVMGCGITLTDIVVESKSPPLQAYRAYYQVQTAESERLEQIEEARRRRSEILNEVAGAVYPKVLEKIREYEQAEREGNPERIARVSAELDQIMLSEVSGRAAEIIAEAIAYRMAVVQEIKADIEKLALLLPEYQANPELVVLNLWQNAKTDILKNPAVEKVYPPARSDELRFLINQNLAGRKYLERQAIRRRVEEAGQR